MLAMCELEHSMHPATSMSSRAIDVPTFACRARGRFLTMRAAAITLQRHARGWGLRKSLACQRSAAVSIQAAWRRYRARRAYLRLRACTIIVQVGCWSL